MPNPRTLPVLAATVAVGTLCALLLARCIPPTGVWSGDQGVKLVQVVNLLRTHFAVAALPYPGATLDPAGTFSPLPQMFTWPHNGAYYVVFSYPYAALTALPLLALGAPGLYIIPVLATCATLLISASLASGLGIRRTWLVPIVVGLATPLCFYALVLWEHALAVALTMLATGCAWRASTDKRAGWAIAAGLLTSMACWMRTEALWYAPALLVGLLAANVQERSQPLRLWQRWRLELAYSSGVGVGLVPLLLLNMRLYGLPLGAQAAFNYTGPAAANVGMFLGLRLIFAQVLLLDINSWFALCSVLGIMALLAPWPWKHARVWLLLALASIVVSSLLIGEPLAIRTGLLSTCPLALLAVCSGLWRARPPVVQFIGVTALVYLLAVMLSAPNLGGAQWGPRYLLPAVPLLMLLGLAALPNLLPRERGLARWTACAALALLLITSFWIQLRSLQRLHETTTASVAVIAAVRAQHNPVVVTDVWYGTQFLGPLYFEYPLFWLSGPQQLGPLHALLQRNHLTRFSYITAQPWSRDPQVLHAAGLECVLGSEFVLDLTLLNCQKRNTAVQR